MDFRRLDKYAQCMEEYFSVQEITKDVPDYVPEKYLNKIDKLLFKEFKRTRRQARREHIKICKSEVKEIRINKRLERLRNRKRPIKGFFKKVFQIFKSKVK